MDWPWMDSPTWTWRIPWKTRDVSIPIRCVSLFISQDILHKTYPLSNHHWCSACMPMLHSLNNPLQKVEVVWSGVSIPIRHSLDTPLLKIEVIWGGLVWRIHFGVAYRDGYARPNHLKPPQFFQEGYRGSGVSKWIRQTEPPQFFEEVVEIVEHWDAGTTSMMVW